MLIHQGKVNCLYTNWFYSRMISMNTIWSLQWRFPWRYLWRCLGWFPRWFLWWYHCAVVQCHDKINWSSRMNNFTGFGCNKTFLYSLESAVNSLRETTIVQRDRCISRGDIGRRNRVVLSGDDRVIIINMC